MKHPWRVLPALLLTAVTVSATTAPSNADVDPTLTVTEVVSGGLDIPWDMAFLPDGSMLYTERSRRLVHLRTPGGVDTVVINTATADAAGVWASGETGMMGIEVAADFSTTGDFITCHGYRREASGTTTQDVRVVRWKLNTAHTSARFVRTLVYTLPSTSGRHGGCALEKGASNSVYVGTGDAATGTNPQNVYSGGGKVLRVNATTGKGMSNNPFHASVRYIAQRIFTYGHRNVQGLARRADGRIWSIEQGSYRDDEVNLLSARGNYGWNPVPRAAGDPSYNEGANSPMTDNTLPGTQLSAKWRSGTQTEATSGGTWLSGAKWKGANGALAVCELKDSQVRFMTFSPGGTLLRTWVPSELDGTYGRLRACVRGPDGNLYVTTSNGSNDKILKVTPS